MITQLDTTNWVSYPFEVNGVKFNSMLDPNGSFYPKVERLPDGVFTAENIRMTLELIGDLLLGTFLDVHRTYAGVDLLGRHVDGGSGGRRVAAARVQLGSCQRGCGARAVRHGPERGGSGRKLTQKHRV